MTKKISLLAWIMLFIFSCKGVKKDETLIITTIYPLKDLIENIAGKNFKVKAIIKPGDSPHTYSPTAEDAKLMEQTNIFIKIGLSGLEIENNIEKMIDNTTSVLSVSKNISSIETKTHTENSHHTRTHEIISNPHIWLSPQKVMIILKNIKNKLSLIYPDKKDKFNENYQNYITEIKKLDNEIKNKINQFKKKTFVEFHPAWQHFANDYGLHIAGHVQEHVGHEETSSLKEIVELIKKSKKMGAAAIFVEPQFNSKAAKKIAAELGINIAVLNPLGGTKETSTYIKLMRYNLKQMEKALK